MIIMNDNNNLPTMEDFLREFYGYNPITDKPRYESKKVNITETDDYYKLDFEVPGFSKEEINIDINDSNIIISSHVEKVDEEFTTKEFSKDSFKREFVLPDDVDIESINATLENGILSISMYKINKKSVETIRKIDIK